MHLRPFVIPNAGTIQKAITSVVFGSSSIWNGNWIWNFFERNKFLFESNKTANSLKISPNWTLSYAKTHVVNEQNSAMNWNALVPPKKLNFLLSNRMQYSLALLLPHCPLNVWPVVWFLRGQHCNTLRVNRLAAWIFISSLRCVLPNGMNENNCQTVMQVNGRRNCTAPSLTNVIRLKNE